MTITRCRIARRASLSIITLFAASAAFAQSEAGVAHVDGIARPVVLAPPPGWWVIPCTEGAAASPAGSHEGDDQLDWASDDALSLNSAEAEILLIILMDLGAADSCPFFESLLACYTLCIPPHTGCSNVNIAPGQSTYCPLGVEGIDQADLGVLLAKWKQYCG